MNSFKHAIFLLLLLLNCCNCSSDSMSISQGQVTQIGGRGTISTDRINTVTYDNLFAINVEFKEGDILQSSISFSNISRANNAHLELTEDWLIAGDSLPFLRLIEYVGGDVALQSYKSAPGSYIKVAGNAEGQTKISFDSLLLLKDIRFQNAPQVSDSILLVEGFFEFHLES